MRRICRCRNAVPRLNALPGDCVVVDLDAPVPLAVYHPLHIRDTGAVLNALELGDLEEITPPSPVSPPPRGTPAQSSPHRDPELKLVR